MPVRLDDSPEQARVTGAQLLLIPPRPRQVCEEIGLNWMAALKLHEDGFLSFAPESTLQLEGAQETELRFVGSLIAAGCDPGLLDQLLNGLHKPYSYNGSMIHYDWARQRWRMIPQPVDTPEEIFFEWLDTLREACDLDTLDRIATEVTETIVTIKERLSEREQ